MPSGMLFTSFETYDVTTVRASTPMYLARVKSMGIKMVLSGEGADEIFGVTYNFFKAPDAKTFMMKPFEIKPSYTCMIVCEQTKFGNMGS